MFNWENKKYLKIFLIVAFVSLFCFFFFGKELFDKNEDDSVSWFRSTLNPIKHISKTIDKPVQGEENNRINILLLGMGGKDHDGGYLTDTIILASLEPSTKKVSLISLPRDLNILDPEVGWRKINNINAYAEFKKENSGGVKTKEVLSTVFNINIHYYIRVDFQGFINIIDILDGITVDVERTLDDYSYPIMGREEAMPYESRFEHLHIDKGEQVMDGKLALKYVRSRHAYGIEGSDFARAKRQQLVIQAAKEKALSKETLFNVKKVGSIIKELNKHVKTDLKIWEMFRIWKLFKDINSDFISNKVLDDGPNGLLYGGLNDSGAYILMPRGNNFQRINNLIANVFYDPDEEVITNFITDQASVEILNGTDISGLAEKVAKKLRKYNFNVVNFRDSFIKDFKKSIIYDLTFGAKKESLNILKEEMRSDASFQIPQWLADDIAKNADIDSLVKPDFILILGPDADIYWN